MLTKAQIDEDAHFNRLLAKHLTEPHDGPGEDAEALDRLLEQNMEDIQAREEFYGINHLIQWATAEPKEVNES